MGNMMMRWIIALSLAVAWCSALADTLTGRVVGVHDGDTLTLLADEQQIKVRLAGIDAPELSQPYGQKAKQALADLIYKEWISVETAGIDRYDRALGTVFVGQTDVNAELIAQGAAWVYRQYPHSAKLLELEKQAQTDQRGLWSLQPDQRCPPWDFRRKACNAASNTAVAGSCGSKRTCKEMTDCAEAQRYFNECGLRQLDRDGDGVPCESLCRH